jgi:hypothetical protein
MTRAAQARSACLRAARRRAVAWSVVIGVACAIAAGAALPLDAAAQVCPTPIERETMALINQRRLDAGLPALPVDVRLVLAARRHSEDMATNDFFSHVGSNGSSFVQRVQADGYPTPRSENIAAGYLSAAAAVEAWMGSPGHRQNILDPVARHIGVGFAVDASSTYRRYWTNDFGMSAGAPQGPPPACMSLTVSANQVQFAPGQALTLSVAVDTTGVTGTADLFVGVVLPDGHTVLLFTDLELHAETVDVSYLAAWRPMVAGIDLAAPFVLARPAFLDYTWGGNEPPGIYTFFVAAVTPGALGDGRADPEDVLVLSAVSIAFTP